MENTYINTLFDTIRQTLFILSDDGYNCLSFDKGIYMLCDVFIEHKTKDSRVFFIGNGGSAAIASHMTADYMKNGGMNTYSLYDSAVVTCMGNDYGYDYVFSKPLDFLINENDLLVAISSSGESQNIINAINTSKEKGSKVVTFTGFKENNSVKSLGDINVWVPCEQYGMVESIHNLVLQQVVDMIMEQDGVSI